MSFRCSRVLLSPLSQITYYVVPTAFRVKVLQYPDVFALGVEAKKRSVSWYGVSTQDSMLAIHRLTDNGVENRLRTIGSPDLPFTARQAGTYNNEYIRKCKQALFICYSFLITFHSSTAFK